jgi:hypothetical protein
MPVPRMRAGRFISLLAGLACAASLAGCDSNPSPAPLPSESPPSASPSATGTPSPTPPAMPDAAKGTGEKSAKAFVRYYIDALNFATSTGDTTKVRAASVPACMSCDSMLDKIETVYRDGGYFRGAGWTITDIKYQPLQPRSRPILSVGVQLAEQEMLERQGGQVERFEGGPNRLTLKLVMSEVNWQVQKLDRLS